MNNKGALNSGETGKDAAYLNKFLLIGDASKAFNKLRGKPEFSVQELVDDMMQSDLTLMCKESYLQQEGYRILNYLE
jgi:GDPmannose 4,6-dehydratase